MPHLFHNAPEITSDEQRVPHACMWMPHTPPTHTPTPVELPHTPPTHTPIETPHTHTHKHMHRRRAAFILRLICGRKCCAIAARVPEIMLISGFLCSQHGAAAGICILMAESPPAPPAAACWLLVVGRRLLLVGSCCSGCAFCGESTGKNQAV